MGSKVGNRGSIRLSSNAANTSNGGAEINGGRSGANQNKQSTGDESKSKRKSARIAQLEAELIPKLSASPEIKGGPKASKPGSVSGNGNTVFVEPELAAPTPSYTGLPLEEFPSNKIKKESLWPAKYRRTRSSDSSRESTATPGDEIENNKVEAYYQNNLKTSLSEDLAQESELRQSLVNASSSKPRKTTRLKLTLRTPTQTSRQQQKRSLDGIANAKHRPLKKIKVTSPTKSPRTKLFDAKTSNSSIVKQEKDKHQEAEEEEIKENDDFCFACGMPGIFICCEKCPKSFHFTCCDPPIEEVPEDEWYCRECYTKAYPESIPDWRDIGVFGQLLNQLETRNPKVFKLPLELREKTFVGVTTEDNGDYVDDSVKDDIPPAKLNGSQIPGCNRDVTLEIDDLYKENGEPFLCHKCGGSGQNRRTLIHCDYCPLVYHIDCLDPPLFGPKTIGDKWRCPNHIEDLLPKGLPKLRQFKETQVVENSLHSNFMKMASISNIFIKYDDEKYLNDNEKPITFDNYKQYKNTSLEKKVLENWGEDMEAIHPEYKVPGFFQAVATDRGVSAQSTKIVALPSALSNKSVIYRVPEKSIVMDFVGKIAKDKLLNEISQYDIQQRLEEDPDTLEAVKSLNEIKERQKILNLDALLQVIGEESKTTKNETLNDNEIQELLKIKQLMKAKGQQALLEFLQS
ncbi:histone deacetylase complex subunit, putative [Candida dubliniensis CD36]|uniref:Histone deacetylase complex subunit, putative n=1 Tax=Candida dubliniensis (strain CD36 / ATCC MYA-646 / CBS 7987 / NCPF 3949 / NRRL Y-17841) TaxID=573826 RepID=B9WK94_CANDC|nr:histone deacetylase complex subunit, putative [Candida dubliniensis CD36]CAX40746.1 histone deacetylase complex subunit, putative [Candida dubliniensis CD36]